MAGYSVFRHADTEVDFRFIVEDNICRLIINVQPELKPIKDLLLIVLPSSPAIANTFVARRIIERRFRLVLEVVNLIDYNTFLLLL